MANKQLDLVVGFKLARSCIVRMSSKTLTVIGECTMHWGGCANTVKFAIPQLPCI